MRQLIGKTVPSMSLILDIVRDTYYILMMIKGYKDAAVEVLYETGVAAPKWRAFSRVAIRKVTQLDAAMTLDDLRAPPANRLEKLRGDRKGQWSIRINDQWRVCFKWDDAPYDVEIVDYH
jgi:toxin HigB-1